MRKEIITNLKATFKETDIYKVLQTGDLANLDGLDKDSLGQLPQLKRLRDVLYSKEFRGFVESVTGKDAFIGPTRLPDLRSGSDETVAFRTSRPPSKAAESSLTRRIAPAIFIPRGGTCSATTTSLAPERCPTFCTSPTRRGSGRARTGGALALYDCIGHPNDGTKKLPLPDFHPVKRILPTWNTMAMFAVLPGKSFHDIEEVVVSDKPRLSISGWWHGEKPPEGSEKATLNQILAKKDVDEESAVAKLDRVDPFVKFPSAVHAEGWLSADDISHLARFINPEYLVRGSVERIAEKFVDESHIQLYKFLNDDLVGHISRYIKERDQAEGMFKSEIPKYTSGIGDSWTMRGPTHKQRFLESAGDGENNVLVKLKTDCFGSLAFQKLVSCMTKVALNSGRASVRRFRPGLDYTLAHSGVETAGYQLDATLCMVEDYEQWGLGEVGGYDCYMVNDTEAKGPNNASAEVYSEAAEDDDETVTLPATRNCLNLVLCNEGVMRFTKYISATAPGSRWDIMNEYEITPDDDEEDGDNKD